IPSCKEFRLSICLIFLPPFFASFRPVSRLRPLRSYTLHLADARTPSGGLRLRSRKSFRLCGATDGRTQPKPHLRLSPLPNPSRPDGWLTRLTGYLTGCIFVSGCQHATLTA